MKKILLLVLIGFAYLQTNAQTTLDSNFLYTIENDSIPERFVFAGAAGPQLRSPNALYYWEPAGPGINNNLIQLKSAAQLYLNCDASGNISSALTNPTTWTVTLDETLAGTISTNVGGTVFYLNLGSDGSLSGVKVKNGNNNQKWKFTSVVGKSNWIRGVKGK